MSRKWPIVLVWLILLAFPVKVLGQLYYTNADGSVYTYNTNADGSANIVGYTGPPWVVTIPTNIEGLLVTTIGTSAFASLTNLASVIIPGSVASIGMNAFSSCTNLTNVSLPESLTNIGEDAFRQCYILPTISIPASVPTIGSGAFGSCNSLTNVAISDGVANIEDEAFNECRGLTSITVPGTVTNVGYGAFYHCSSLTNFTINNGVTSSIGDEAFFFCTNLTSVTIGDGVTNLGGEAFGGCPLTNVVLANGLIYIGNYAFENCRKLGSVTIPAGVTGIGEGAFQYCTNMISVYFYGNAPSADTSVFYKDVDANIYYLPGTTGWSLTFWGFPFAGPPAVLWNPVIQTNDTSFGVQSNQFGFTITNGSIPEILIVVEACTNLTNPVWVPLQTNILTNTLYFSDPQWSNYPARYYGIGFP